MAGKTSIVIVGGGCSGTLVAAQLLRKGYRGRLVIIEPRRELGRGLAYSTRSDHHLLNVPAGKMSAFPEHPSHFLDWLRIQGCLAAEPGMFAPRRMYGEYLADVLQHELNCSPSGADFSQICGEAVSIRTDRDVAHVLVSNGDCVEADRVVLAVGNPASSPDFNVEMTGTAELFHPSPWVKDALSLRFPSERFLLLGTGLTAVDSLLSLLSQGENSVVHMVSRRGFLPHAHTTCLPPPEFAPLRGTGSVTSTLREFRARVEAMKRMGFCWRVAIDALRPISNQIWHGLPLADQQMFLRHLKPYWELHRHRVAPVIAEQTKRYLVEGRLCLNAGRVRKLIRTGDSIQVHISRREAGELQLEVDRVINCTGIQEDYSDCPRPLARQLIADGTASANDLGIGFRTDGSGALVNSERKTSKLLFTLGPPRRGQLFETTAVPEIRTQAEALARHLIES
jgi:uncharacterized NAD(P)/FAD-binding protein YdhS